MFFAERKIINFLNHLSIMEGGAREKGNLQIKLRSKGESSTEAGGGAKPSVGETVTAACPEHLVISDLPVAKGLGSLTTTSIAKTVGYKTGRQLGKRVHFCVRCDFPIAIYGRLVSAKHYLLLPLINSYFFVELLHA